MPENHAVTPFSSTLRSTLAGRLRASKKQAEMIDFRGETQALLRAADPFAPPVML